MKSCSVYEISLETNNYQPQYLAQIWIKLVAIYSYIGQIGQIGQEQQDHIGKPPGVLSSYHKIPRRDRVMLIATKGNQKNGE